MRMLLVLTLIVVSPLAGQDFSEMKNELAALCADNGVLGLSAAVSVDGEVRWSWGFGKVSPGKEQTPDLHTPFRIASLSKPIAAMLCMRLVEQGMISLDDRVEEHAGPLPGGMEQNATIRQVLSHTSHNGGQSYSYHGGLYDFLTVVMERHYSRQYPRILAEEIFQPLSLEDASGGQFLDTFSPVNQRMAQPLEIDSETGQRKEFTRFNACAAAAVILSVSDIVRIDTAFDQGLIVSRDSYQEMTKPFELTDGSPSCYGLGWFVQDYRGNKLIWHYGWWDSTSALWLKLPQKKTTFVLLSNSEGLSKNFSLGNGDVTCSPFAMAFLRLVLPE